MFPMQSHFDRSLLPPPRAFYRREFGSALGKERRGWVQTRCCFHDGRSKTSLALNMASGGFHCFSPSCGARGGDLVSFVRLRDGLGFVAAAKQLGAWRESLTRNDQARIARERKQREQELTREEARKVADRRSRIRLRDELHTTNRLMREISHALRNDEDNEALWHCLQLAWECRELDEREYVSVAGLEAH